MVRVPIANDMPVDIFHKHMNKRHVAVDGIAPYPPQGVGTDGGDHWVSVAYHNHLHRQGRYDHTHEDLVEQS